MNPINQGSNGINIDGRYRTMLIVWFAILMSVSIMFMLTLIIERPAAGSGAPLLVWILMALGFLLFALSFLLRRKLLAQSVREQRVDMVQSAMILAVALCETVGMFGLLIYFIGATPFYYLFFILSALGILLHMPRREQLLAASYKGQGLG